MAITVYDPDPDPAAVRAMSRLFSRLSPSIVAQFCNTNAQVKDELIQVAKRALETNDVESAWKTILEARFVNKVGRICPTTMPPTPGVFDTLEDNANSNNSDNTNNSNDNNNNVTTIVANDVIEDITKGIRGIGQGIGSLPIALIILAAAIIGGSILLTVFKR